MAGAVIAPKAQAACSGGAPNGASNSGEQCDDGNAVDTDGCSNACIVNAGFACSCPAGQLTGVTVDDPQTTLAAVGGTGGGPFSDRCPTGQVTVGFDYTVGPFTGPSNWITSSRARCGTLSISGASVTITAAGTTTTRGAGGGSTSALSCPAGSVVAGFIGDSRNEGGFIGIAGVQLYCAPLTVGGDGRVQVGTAAAGPSARPGGGAITVVGPSLCPAGQVVSGNEGRAGAIIDRFTMLCQTVYTNCAVATPCASVCGNGIRSGAETCDDGNVAPNDGCSATCAIETGFACTGSPSICGPICGNSVTHAPETCDDGNTTASDGCSTTCRVEAGYTCVGTVCTAVCGNGIRSGAETCEDGN